MINTIIFDFDGTIADTFAVGLEIINAAAPKYGFSPFSPSDIDTFRSKSLKSIFEELHIPLLKAPFFIKEIANQLHQQMNHINPIVGIPETLAQLKQQQYSLNIITSNTVDVVNLFLSHHHLQIFDQVYSDKSLFGKHVVIKKYLAKHRIKPSQAIYVGDEIRDIEAAHQAGLKIISVTWGLNSKAGLAQSHPDYLIDSPDQLISTLAQLN